MKKKQLKKFSLSNSNKKKHRKQEQNNHFRQLSEKNFTNPTDYYYFNQKNQDCPPHPSPNTAKMAPFFSKKCESFTRSNHTYEKGEAKKKYLYEFTNSRFIYFLGTLDPKSYIVFITLINLLISEDLNMTEMGIIYTLFSSLGDTMQTLVEQEVILQEFRQEEEERHLGNALDQDFKAIYAELEQIKKKLSTM